MKILLATDFSETSQAAVRVALTYASALGADVHILHVIERDEQAGDGVAHGGGRTFRP